MGDRARTNRSADSWKPPPGLFLHRGQVIYDTQQFLIRVNNKGNDGVHTREHRSERT